MYRRASERMSVQIQDKFSLKQNQLEEIIDEITVQDEENYQYIRNQLQYQKIDIKSIKVQDLKVIKNCQQIIEQIILSINREKKNQMKIDFLYDSLLYNDFQANQILIKTEEKQSHQFIREVRINFRIYQKFLSYFFSHPCLTFKVILQVQRSNSFTMRKKILKFFTQPFTFSNSLHQSYLYSLSVCFLKHEINFLNLMTKNDGSFSFSDSIFKYLYKKLLFLEPHRKNFFQNLKSDFSKQINKSKKMIKKLSTEKQYSLSEITEAINLEILQVYVEILKKYFKENSINEFIDPIILSLNQKIFLSLKKLSKQDIQEFDKNFRIKIFLVNLFLSNFLEVILKKQQKEKIRNFHTDDSFVLHDETINNSIDDFLSVLINNTLFYLLELQIRKNSNPYQLVYNQMIDIYHQIFQIISTGTESQMIQNSVINFKEKILDQFQPKKYISINYQYLYVILKSCIVFKEKKQSENESESKESEEIISEIDELGQLFIDDKVDQEQESVFVEYQDKYNFINNKSLNKLLSLVNLEKQEWDQESSKETLQLILFDEELPESQQEYVFCNFCEVIVSKKNSNDLDRKIKDIIVNQGWPCREQNTHYYNSVDELQCFYVNMKNNKVCQKTMNEVYYQYFTIFKQFPLVRYVKNERLQKIHSTCELIKKLKGNNLKEFIEIIFKQNIVLEKYFNFQLEIKKKKIEENLSIMKTYFFQTKNLKRKFFRFFETIRIFIRKIYTHQIQMIKLETMIDDLKIQVSDLIKNWKSKQLEKLNLIVNYKSLKSIRVIDVESTLKKIQEIHLQKNFQHYQLEQYKAIFSIIFNNNSIIRKIERQLNFQFFFNDFQFKIILEYQSNWYDKREKISPIIDSFEISLDQISEVFANFKVQPIYFFGEKCSFHSEPLIKIFSLFSALLIKEFQSFNQFNNLLWLHFSQMNKKQNSKKHLICLTKKVRRKFQRKN